MRSATPRRASRASRASWSRPTRSSRSSRNGCRRSATTLLVIEQRLLDKAAELERVNRYKSEFLANMSHELRTPLNSSLIMAKLLAENRSDNLTAEQVRFAETIVSSGNDLLTLINDVLDLAKIDAGKIDIAPETVDLPRLLDWAKSMFEPVAQEKRVEFEARLAEGAPATVATDPQRLRQILKNLLANAFKFTETGRVTLSIAAAEDDARPLRGARHRHRDRAVSAPGDLRGVPAGRWHHPPALRRHRARVVDLARAGAPPRRRHRSRKRARRGERVHGDLAAQLRGPGRAPARSSTRALDQWRASGACRGSGGARGDRARQQRRLGAAFERRGSGGARDRRSHEGGAGRARDPGRSRTISRSPAWLRIWRASWASWR